MDYVFRWFYERATKAERCEAPIIEIKKDEAATMPLLCAGRMEMDEGAVGVLVAYVDQADEQLAFNIAASSLPEGVKLTLGSLRGGADWTYLPSNHAPDPMAQRGYIGWHLPPQEVGY